MDQDPAETQRPAEVRHTATHHPTEKPPLLSLCVIARDNEQTIHDALASAKPWVDEIIVVDTGSTDRTPDIAREFGARVEHFPWCDDFAAARNESLQYATGQWLFWMDTDDTLPPECGKQLRDTLTSEDKIPQDVLGLIMQVHCPPTSMESSAYGHSVAGSGSVTVVDHVKVLRNRPKLRFEGRIHEQILPAIRRAGGKVLWTDSYVVHSGSDHSREGVRRKLDRDLRLLRMDVQDRPGHPFVLFNLGMTLLHRNEYEEARTTLEDCVNQSTTDESHLRKAYALLIDALEHLGEKHEARRRCWEGLGRYPEDPELAFKLGRLLMLRQAWKEAIEAFQRILGGSKERYFASIDPGIKGHKTFANLATCHEELEQWNEAIGAWHACLKDVPGFEDAWEGVLRGSRAIKDLQPLIQFADELKEQPVARSFVLTCEGIVLDAQGNYPEAERRFESALETGDHSKFALNEYARFLIEHQQWEASLSTLRKLRGLNPANPSPHYNLGACLQQLGRYKEAANALHTSLQLRPGHRPTQGLMRVCAKKIRQASTRECDTTPPAENETNAGTELVAHEQHPPKQVIIAPCFIKQPDPQRGVVWDEEGDLAAGVDHWIQGIVDLKLSGTILYDGLTDAFIAERTSEYISFHHCPQSQEYSPNDFRFWAILQYLDSYPEIEQVFCTDLFDVRVAQNPFELLIDCGPLCVGVEPSSIGENTWMQHQWQRVWGTPVPEKLTAQPVLNAGILGGDRDRVIQLCKSMHHHIKDRAERCHNSNMPVFNYIMYEEIGEGHFWAKQEPLHSVFRGYEYERDDVAFIHK